MSEQSVPEPQNVQQLQASLRHLAAALRNAGHLKPETQKSLASLLDELSADLGSTGAASTEKTQLAAAVSEMARSLQQQHPESVLGSARERLENAAVRAEAEAPVATGVVYRIIDVLSGIGI